MRCRLSVATLSFLTFGVLLACSLPASAQVDIVHSFTRVENVAGVWPPWGPNDLIKGQDGKLYGVTRFGGANCDTTLYFTYWGSCGVVFELAPQSAGAAVTAIHDFDFRWYQQAVRLSWSGTGELLMAEDGGSAYYPGSLGKLTPAADGPWPATVLHPFGSEHLDPADPTTCNGVWSDGTRPMGPALLASDGRLFGTTVDGGNGGVGGCYTDGTLYRLWPDGTGYERLHSFTSSADYSGNPGTGASPMGALTQGSDGHVYGVTYAGGSSNYWEYGYGTIFRLRGDTDQLERIHSFNYATGGGPRAGLVQGPDGRFFGTTGSIPYAAGTLYSMSVGPEAGATAAITTLHVFANAEGQPSDGSELVLGPDGFLYGTTSGQYGNPAPDNLGLLFRIRPDGTDYEVVHRFTGPNGARPSSALVVGADQNLYGTALEGGPGGGGVVFRLDLAPTVQIGGPYVVKEGEEAILQASGADPQGEPVTFAWDLDADGQFDDATGATVPFATNTPDRDGNGTYDVSVRVTDPTGLTATATTTVTVKNVAPTVSVAPATLSLVPGETGSLTATFSDPGPDTWTMEVDYGDGTTATTTPASPGAVALTHAWARPGTFTVSVTVWDDDGASGTTGATVEVGTPADSVEWLIDEVEELVREGTLNDGQGNSLIVKLKRALHELQAGDVASAVRRLETFINEVSALRNAGTLSEDEADSMIGIAQRAIDSVSG